MYEELRRELDLLKAQVAKLQIDNENLINFPHTIFTVASVLNLRLVKDQREKAGLLAYKIFKVKNPDQEPIKVTINGEPICRYAYDDAWLIIAAINRIAHGPTSTPPTEDQLSTEQWTRCLLEMKLQ
jgi:hypothetical protein